MNVGTRTLVIDGVKYELAVRDEATGFYGASFCKTCWDGVVKYSLLRSIDDAFAPAQALAEQHHSEQHRKSA